MFNWKPLLPFSSPALSWVILQRLLWEYQERTWTSLCTRNLSCQWRPSMYNELRSKHFCYFPILNLTQFTTFKPIWTWIPFKDPTTANPPPSTFYGESFSGFYLPPSEKNETQGGQQKVRPRPKCDTALGQSVLEVSEWPSASQLRSWQSTFHLDGDRELSTMGPNSKLLPEKHGSVLPRILTPLEI